MARWELLRQMKERLFIQEIFFWNQLLVEHAQSLLWPLSNAGLKLLKLIILYKSQMSITSPFI
jgi:hypothetical protein